MAACYNLISLHNSTFWCHCSIKSLTVCVTYIHSFSITIQICTVIQRNTHAVTDFNSLQLHHLINNCNTLTLLYHETLIEIKCRQIGQQETSHSKNCNNSTTSFISVDYRKRWQLSKCKRNFSFSSPYLPLYLYRSLIKHFPGL